MESFSVRLWRGMLAEGVEPGHIRSMVSDHIHALGQIVPSAESPASDIQAAISDAQRFLESL